MSLLQLRIMGVCGAAIVLWIAYGLWHHKVYQDGYETCQQEQTKAALDADNKARVKIKEVNKSYEATEKKLLKETDPIVPIGHRIAVAIDSMPEPSGHSR